MIYDIYFVIGLRTKEGSFSPYIDIHPFLIIYNVAFEENKVFFFNLTTADHYNESLNYINNLETNAPLLVEAKKQNNSDYKMYIVGDCSVVNEENISSFKNLKKETVVMICDKYKCKNYKELKTNILKAIYENPFDIITYDGKTGKIIEYGLNESLFLNIEKVLYDNSKI